MGTLLTPFKIEIQVRTALQDVWNAVSHQAYEIARMGDDPKSLPREYAQVSALLEVAGSLIEQFPRVTQVTSQIATVHDLQFIIQEIDRDPKEERKKWEFKELWNVITAKQITSSEQLIEKWGNFKEKKQRATGSDILDFGAYLCASSDFPASSYYAQYPQYFSIYKQQ